jgi:hypothetical protein
MESRVVVARGWEREMGVTARGCGVLGDAMF